MIDEILEKAGLKYEDLNATEKQTFHSMLEQLNKSGLTPAKLKDYVISMRDAVEQELVNEPEFIRILGIFAVPNRKQIYLKARLRNYMLLQAFLSTPEKAREQLENALSGMIAKK